MHIYEYVLFQTDGRNTCLGRGLLGDSFTECLRLEVISLFPPKSGLRSPLSPLLRPTCLFPHTVLPYRPSSPHLLPLLFTLPASHLSSSNSLIILPSSSRLVNSLDFLVSSIFMAGRGGGAAASLPWTIPLWPKCRCVRHCTFLLPELIRQEGKFAETVI